MAPHDRETDSNGRAVAMQDREREVEKKIGSDKLDATIRAHYIGHCFSCVVKRRLYDRTPNASHDDESLTLGLVAIFEIANGPFTSPSVSNCLKKREAGTFCLFSLVALRATH